MMLRKCFLGAEPHDLEFEWSESSRVVGISRHQSSNGLTFFINSSAYFGYHPPLSYCKIFLQLCLWSNPLSFLDRGSWYTGWPINMYPKVFSHSFFSDQDFGLKFCIYSKKCSKFVWHSFKKFLISLPKITWAHIFLLSPFSSLLFQK